MPDMKRCTRCNIEKDIDEFGIVRRNKDGHREVCKACYKEIRSMPEYKEKRRKYLSKPENIERRKIKHQEPKTKEKVKEYNHRPEVKERRRRYYQDYYLDPHKKEQHKEYMKNYSQQPENKLKAKRYMKEYFKRPEVIEKLNSPEHKAYRKEYQRKYMSDWLKTLEAKRYRQEYNKRPEVIKRKKEGEQTPEWKAAHAHVQHRRRCKIKEIENTLTVEQWNKIIELQGNACAICHKAFTKKNPATRDHIIPASRAGPFTRENCQAVHKDCNSKKKDKIDKSNIVSWITRPDLCVEEMP